MGGTTKRATTIVTVLLTVLASAIAGCTDDGGSEDAFCREVRSLPPLDSVINGFSEADPGQLETRLTRASSAYEDLRAAAPSEIRGSVGDMVDLVDAVLDAVEANRDDPEAAVDALRTAVVENPDAPLASRRVVDYAADSCDVVLNPTLDAETTDDSGTDTKPTVDTAPEPSTGN